LAYIAADVKTVTPTATQAEARRRRVQTCFPQRDRPPPNAPHVRRKTPSRAWPMTSPGVAGKGLISGHALSAGISLPVNSPHSDALTA